MPSFSKNHCACFVDFAGKQGGYLVRITDYTGVYCIIGAGSSGLAAAKNLKQHGIPCEIIEAEDDVGGNWYYGKPRSSVYRSTHLISSKPLTEYTDFPMPANYPDFPGHQQYDDLLVAGFIQPDSGQFGLVDYQTQLIAKFIHAQKHNPKKAKVFRKLKSAPAPDLSSGIKYLDSTRHYVEVEHYSYRRRLKRLIAKMS
jgi:hypothetical protein